MIRDLVILPQITKRETASFTAYLQEVSKISKNGNLTKEQEVDLAFRIHGGDAAALAELVSRNLRFVISVAKQYHCNTCSLEDLVSEGNFGLIKAAQRFDETRGFKFISYAVWWIRQTILCYINDNGRTIRLPISKISQLSKIRKFQTEFEQKNERLPTTAEILDNMEMNIDFADINNSFMLGAGALSLDKDISDDGSKFTLMDTLADSEENSINISMDREDMKSTIKRILSKLPDQHRQILEMFYGLNGNYSKSVAEIGEHFNLGSERIRQIKDKTLFQLKRSSKNNKLIQQCTSYY
jgi:RNA polymerase primary sigma factor